MVMLTKLWRIRYYKAINYGKNECKICEEATKKVTGKGTLVLIEIKTTKKT